MHGGTAATAAGETEIHRPTANDPSSAIDDTYLSFSVSKAKGLQIEVDGVNSVGTYYEFSSICRVELACAFACSSYTFNSKPSKIFYFILHILYCKEIEH
jgi:hypothetical protein